MLIMGLIKDYLHQYGYSEAGLEDFLLHDAHSFYYHPIKETLFGEPLWDHQDRLHGDLVTKVMRTATKQEAVYICKWLHQCLALGFNEDINPLGAAGVLVLYGRQNITPFLEKLSLEPDAFLNKHAHLDLNNSVSIKQALSAWITRLDAFPSPSGSISNCGSNGGSNGGYNGIYANKDAKSFFMANQDIHRPFFATKDLMKPRRTSFCINVPELTPRLTAFTALTALAEKHAEDYVEGNHAEGNHAEGHRAECRVEDYLPKGYRDSIFWPVNADNIDMDYVNSLDRSWFQQLWMQVYDELYAPNPKGFTLDSRPDQEDSALKFYGTQMRWREEDEEPGDKVKIYEAYKAWCQEAPKDRVLQRPEWFFNTIIHHMKDNFFQDIETEDKRGLKEFTLINQAVLTASTAATTTTSAKTA